jgi:hypothetical protein
MYLLPPLFSLDFKGMWKGSLFGARVGVRRVLLRCEEVPPDSVCYQFSARLLAATGSAEKYFVKN